MRKIFLILTIIVLILTPTLLNAGDLSDLSFEPHASLSCGYIPEFNSFETTLTIGGSIWYKWMGLWIFGRVDTRSDHYEGLSYMPYSDKYKVGGKLMFGQKKTEEKESIHLYLFYEHYCIHPVYSDWEQFADNFYGENMTIYGVGFQFGTRY
jgi:hypothetical protein